MTIEKIQNRFQFTGRSLAGFELVRSYELLYYLHGAMHVQDPNLASKIEYIDITLGARRARYVNCNGGFLLGWVAIWRR